MVSRKYHHQQQNPPPKNPLKNQLPRHQPLSPQDKCAANDEPFDVQEFLAEVRSLTPDERERLIRSYAR